MKKKSVKPAYTGTNNSSTYIASLGISFVEPVQGMLTSGFGVRRRDNHKGLDIANSMGTPIKRQQQEQLHMRNIIVEVTEILL